MDSDCPYKMDNSGRGELRVPGFGGIPVHYELPLQDRFTNGMRDWIQAPAVTRREYAMIAVMNAITDEAMWHEDVFKDDVLARWKTEWQAKEPLLSDPSWQWCVKELRDKAVFFSTHRFVEVLDTGVVVCKSDTLLPQSFSSDLTEATQVLLRDTDTASALVDPFLYPLVFGQTNALADGGFLEIDRSVPLAITWTSTLTAAVPSEQPEEVRAPRGWARRHNYGYYDYDSDEDSDDDLVSMLQPQDHLWSYRFQALPCDISFRPGAGRRIQIDSYINNLPPKHGKIYTMLEDIISAAIKPWNRCLVRGRHSLTSIAADNRHARARTHDQRQLGRKPLRILTFGAEWKDTLPSWAIAFDTQYQRDVESARARAARGRTSVSGSTAAASDQLVADMSIIPTPDQATWDLASAYLQLPEPGSATAEQLPEHWNIDTSFVWPFLHQKALRAMHWVQPEPGKSFTYEDWLAGHNVDNAIIGENSADDLASGPGRSQASFQQYQVCLEEEFREQGMQVVVKMSSIHLDPHDTEPHEDSWSYQGHLNEHIVATSIVAYDMENVSTDLLFQQHVSPATRLANDQVPSPKRWTWTRASNGSAVFRSALADNGPALRSMFRFQDDEQYHPLTYRKAIQAIGKISLRAGRLIAFPNLIESRLDARLIDASRGGHVRFVTVNLVDPNYRLCSTRNVPPQQPSWLVPWLRFLLGKKLPNELTEQIINDCLPQDNSREYLSQMQEEVDWMAHTIESSTLQWWWPTSSDL